MAVHYIEIPIDVQDLTADDQSHTHADGSEEINLGAFRGLAFALLFETVLVILGSLGWEIWRVLR